VKVGKRARKLFGVIFDANQREKNLFLFRGKREGSIREEKTLLVEKKN